MLHWNNWKYNCLQEEVKNSRLYYLLYYVYKPLTNIFYTYTQPPSPSTIANSPQSTLILIIPIEQRFDPHRPTPVSWITRLLPLLPLIPTAKMNTNCEYTSPRWISVLFNCQARSQRQFLRFRAHSYNPRSKAGCCDRWTVDRDNATVIRHSREQGGGSFRERFPATNGAPRWKWSGRRL